MKKGKSWVLFYFMTIAAVLLLAQWGSSAVTTISENTPILRKHCIVVDAGHGGVDGGTTSCTGILESGFNLSIAKRLNDLLCFMGYDTVMVRTEDISVYTSGETIAQKKASDLKERIRIVNSAPNRVLLSIHQNHYPDQRYKGAQIFYAGTEGSLELAKALQAAFSATINPGNNREVKRSRGVYLMEHIHQPGVLIECGFLSNPVEEAALRTDEYQKKISCVIAATVSQHLSNT